MSELPISIPSIRRRKTSLRVDPLIWTPFVNACTKTGDSTCGVLEPYMFAYTEAVKRGVPVQAANLTLNLTVVREVQKERRRLPKGAEDLKVVTVGSEESCAVCKRPSVFKISWTPSPGLSMEMYLCWGCEMRVTWNMGHYGHERVK